MTDSHEGLYLEGGAKPESSLPRFLLQNRVWFLLFVLAAHIGLSPLISQFSLMEVFIDVGLILACVATAADSRKHLIFALVVGLPAAALFILAVIFKSRELAWIAYLLTLVLYLHVIRLFMKKIFHATTVTLDTIGMALCTYILIGTLWMMFYIPVYSLNPESFSFNVAPVEGQSTSALFTYFSYVTLTTLGYGDISPVSEVARALAVLEALTGTLFLAVLISRLVGSYSNKNPE